VRLVREAGGEPASAAEVRASLNAIDLAHRGVGLSPQLC
jgi:hypothetical protein